jgi:hypothetical protein
MLRVEAGDFAWFSEAGTQSERARAHLVDILISGIRALLASPHTHTAVISTKVNKDRSFVDVFELGTSMSTTIEHTTSILGKQN